MSAGISIFYDSSHPGIYIIGAGIVFPPLTLIAIQNVDGTIEVWTANNTARIVGPIDYSRVLNQANTGFGSATDAYNYLVSQFTQQPPSVGGTTANTYSYNFTVSSIWTIVHNFNLYPSVTLLDTAGNEFDANVQYVNANVITITMNAPTSGTVLLNCGCLT